MGAVHVDWSTVAQFLGVALGAAVFELARRVYLLTHRQAQATDWQSGVLADLANDATRVVGSSVRAPAPPPLVLPSKPPSPTPDPSMTLPPPPAPPTRIDGGAGGTAA